MDEKYDLEAAKAHLWMRGSMLLDLSQNDEYVLGLLRGHSLSKIERTLKNEINLILSNPE